MASGNLDEKPERVVTIPVSIARGIVFLIPTLVVTGAAGFFFRGWLLWAIPALIALAVWAIMFSQVRSQLKSAAQRQKAAASAPRVIQAQKPVLPRPAAPSFVRARVREDSVNGSTHPPSQKPEKVSASSKSSQGKGRVNAAARNNVVSSSLSVKQSRAS